MRDTLLYRQKLVERIKQLHAYVKGMYALTPDIENAVRSDETLDRNEREGLLRLFFLTSQSWTIWQYTDELGEKSMHKGMAFVTGAIDMEYCDERPGEFVGIDFSLPTLTAPEGRDWRVGTFNLYGNDTDEAPLDVTWTPAQTQLDDDEDAELL